MARARLWRGLICFCRNLAFFSYTAGDCTCRTRCFASSAANTFRTVDFPNRIDFHQTGAGAFTAADTFVRIYTVAEDRYLIENGVKGSERADVFAEWPIDQDRKENRDDQDCVFPQIKPANCASHGFV